MQWSWSVSEALSCPHLSPVCCLHNLKFPRLSLANGRWQWSFLRFLVIKYKKSPWYFWLFKRWSTGNSLHSWELYKEYARDSSSVKLLWRTEWPSINQSQLATNRQGPRRQSVLTGTGDRHTLSGVCAWWLCRSRPQPCHLRLRLSGHHNEASGKLGGLYFCFGLFVFFYHSDVGGAWLM